MRLRTRLAGLALIAGATLALTACETETDSVVPDEPSYAVTYPVQLSDGRTVDCVYIRDMTEDHETTGGPSCDWGRAK